jgi:hypothetical protein
MRRPAPGDRQIEKKLHLVAPAVRRMEENADEHRHQPEGPDCVVVRERALVIRIGRLRERTLGRVGYASVGSVEACSYGH